MLYQFTRSVGGIMVSIAAFQAVDPSSILGHRIIFYMLLFVSALMQWIIMILKTCLSIFVLIATFNTAKPQRARASSTYATIKNFV
jgi:hypothetical protein